ncbi:MAG: D-alanine--D-alanine ligase [Bdellovibrio sp.]|nr:D-alanine--D-alanine ligase [Bdellovibrio sp.]
MKNKIKVAILYGGRSGEHEISLQSAASVIRNLDQTRFEVIPVSIDKQGKWCYQDYSLLTSSTKALPVFKNAPEIFIPQRPLESEKNLLTVNGQKETRIDIVFPVLHGPLGEDGTVQGFLELAEIPYVGAGVLASALGMDKEKAKILAKDADIPIVPYVTLRQALWEKEKISCIKKIKKDLQYPVFVKPANMGSSVGVHRVRDEKNLEPALIDAFRYDKKILVEKAVSAREIEVSILENTDPNQLPLASVPGEVISHHEFYSYEAKYMDEKGAELIIPAHLTAQQIKRAQEIASGVFIALDCEGMGRVDLFLEKESGSFYFSEINTIPGFTTISMYPKLWEASGISYKELLTRLIELALARHERKKTLCREYKP